MKFIKTDIPDLIICEPEIFGDDRGYFMETFRADRLQEFLGFNISFCQDNESSSTFGVLRGMHYQLPPFAQTKLIRVMEGVVWDVVIDIRKGSPTFGKKMCIELSGENKRQLFVPRGFAHGFVVISDFARFAYKVDNYYSREHERGIAFNDKELNIDWKVPKEKLKLSQKDTEQSPFKEAEYFDYNTNLYV